jgi:hypothetical protein
MATFDLDSKIAEQESNDGKVQVSAVEKAKENLAQRKLEQEAREVERRLSSAEDTETRALKALRLARKKEDAQKKYLTAVSEAKAEFETTGDYNKYDKTVDDAETARDKAIDDAKRAIYGNDAWRY